MRQRESLSSHEGGEGISRNNPIEKARLWTPGNFLTICPDGSVVISKTRKELEKNLTDVVPGYKEN